MTSPIVLIESPYCNGDRNANLRYLTWCEYHSASMGEVPIASHANCTAYWPEDEAHREKGFAWRDRIRSICTFVAYYTDLGVSLGAQKAMERDEALGGVWGVTLIKRTLPGYLMREFWEGCYPPGSMMRISR